MNILSNRTVLLRILLLNLLYVAPRQVTIHYPSLFSLLHYHFVTFTTTGNNRVFLAKQVENNYFVNIVSR